MINVEATSESFSRHQAIYLLRPLSEVELEEIRQISWSARNQVIVDLLMERNNEQTAADVINERLRQRGYRDAKAKVYYCKGSISSMLYQHAKHFQFSFGNRENGHTGNYRFFRKKDIESKTSSVNPESEPPKLYRVHYTVSFRTNGGMGLPPKDVVNKRHRKIGADTDEEAMSKASEIISQQQQRQNGDVKMTALVRIDKSAKIVKEEVTAVWPVPDS